MEDNQGNTWEWDASVMTDDESKAKLRNDPLSTADLIYSIMNTLGPLFNNMVDGTVSWFSAVCLTKDMWDATNFARLWPEANHQRIDVILQDALSHIAEAHYMIESMWAWDRFTETAMTNVAREISEGITFLKRALLETEYYLYTLQGEKDGDDESRE
jgi:hypothetical protein